MSTTITFAVVLLTLLSAFITLDVGVAYPYRLEADKKADEMALLDGGNVGDDFEEMWRRAYSPISAVDTSVKEYSSIISCSVGQICKPAAKRKFSCKCNIFTYCVAPGKFSPAQCKWSAVGYVYKQP